MEKSRALELLQTSMEKHGLIKEGWGYLLSSKMRNVLGLCVYKQKMIKISKLYVELNDENLVADTILHEIAHALLGPGHGHSKSWKRKCVEVGAMPQRCKNSSMGLISADTSWIFKCPNGCCKGERHTHKMSRKYFCRKCKSEIIWERK